MHGDMASHFASKRSISILIYIFVAFDTDPEKLFSLVNSISKLGEYISSYNRFDTDESQGIFCLKDCWWMT